MKKIVLITGANSDIGIAITEVFLKKKYTVLLNVRNQKNKNKILDFFKDKYEYNSDYFIYAFDISDDKKVNFFFNQILKKFKKIDCLINNASITDSLSINSIKNYKKVFETNFFGALNCILKFSKQKNNNKKCIVNLSSEVSKKGSIKLPAYASSKSAMDNITKSMSATLIKKNIRINSVLPSLVLTSKILASKNIKTLEKKLPIKRIAKPIEIANLIYFLCSDDSSYISGSFIKIDGGNNF